MHKHRHWPQHTKLESKVLCDSEGPRKTTAEIMKQNENHTHTHTSFHRRKEGRKRNKSSTKPERSNSQKTPIWDFSKVSLCIVAIDFGRSTADAKVCSIGQFTQRERERELRSNISAQRVEPSEHQQKYNK